MSGPPLAGTAGRGSDPEPRGLFITLIMVVAIGLALAAILITADHFVEDGGLRLLVSGIILAVLGISITLAAVLWSREPDRWRHRFTPQRYADADFGRLTTALSAAVPVGAPVVVPLRLLAATWVREVLAERLMMGLRVGPADLREALEMPRQSGLLRECPAMRRFLEETRDLGMARKGTVLTVSREEFLRLAGAALREADDL
jgi:hypothetical protein